MRFGVGRGCAGTASKAAARHSSVSIAISAIRDALLEWLYRPFDQAHLSLSSPLLNALACCATLPAEGLRLVACSLPGLDA